MNEVIINIMTWNTSLYSEKTAQPFSKKCDIIFSVVKEQLRRENAVVFLQEIPYYSNETWEQHSLFSALSKEFSAENYDVLFNISNRKQIMMTIAIATKGSAILANDDVYPNGKPTNRECAVIFKGLNILGIHARNAEDNEKYLKSINGRADIILGDFNAGNYLESENRILFNQILKNHICICNIPTRVDPFSERRTCIDHIFVREHLITRCSNLIVHENIKYSDHFPITFELELST